MKIPADLIAFAVAFVGSLLLTIPIRRLALRYGMVDHPGPRKVHVSPMPLLGGIAIYLGFVLAVLLTLYGAPQKQIGQFLLAPRWSRLWASSMTVDCSIIR